ncbi:MAG: hypothetical protein WDN04_00175 [Rhodospirillales bacterium]
MTGQAHQRCDEGGGDQAAEERPAPGIAGAGDGVAENAADAGDFSVEQQQPSRRGTDQGAAGPRKRSTAASARCIHYNFQPNEMPIADSLRWIFASPPPKPPGGKPGGMEPWPSTVAVGA